MPLPRLHSLRRSVRNDRVLTRFLFASLVVTTTALAPPLAAAEANAPPRIWGRPASVANRDVLYTFRPAAADADGDRLRFAIVNKPRWMWFDERTGKLSGRPHWAQRNRTFGNIVIKVSDGQATTALPAFSITVGTRGNAAPVISGRPGRSVAFGTRYGFRPRATDANGDRLRFTIANKPAWATFVASTGALYGTPTWRHAGTWSGIVIRVSDGKTTTRLPAFSIVVRRPSTNRAPTIAGRPVTSAQVGRPYAFRPAAADRDDDPLRFSVAGKPDWARFDAATGTLSGTPTAADVGRYANVTIRVTDGRATATLAPFTIGVQQAATRSVTLTWTAPTRNTDGSSLTNLSGYRLHYGQASRQYSQAVRVGANATSAVIEDLAPGTWYFSIESLNSAGVSSRYSGEVRTTL